ncbi:DUF2642 domain-containing protein [Paenibacillus provencensis]|uniref:DUF2642 domain-containing protein n=1 Tax=Paenibacillus provencensis TaxID=441151 RepID=A0ABW3Q451_9BACL|nr:DUF2642 domain-containing protein [Paenibacillus sp. MER 78]MCM3129126.1 DUF2642 domain-containing protein [Paenibacillus sp. MER 78]
MQVIDSWLGKQIELSISGCKNLIQGEVIDVGNDIVVLYGDFRYVYVPLHHLQYLRLSDNSSTVTEEPPDPSLDHSNISYRKILMHARGIFSEISVGDKALHGYVTSIMNDYFVFYSPLHRSVYVSVEHVKYIIPYPPNVRPFSLSQEYFPIQPTSMSLSRTLDQQLKKLKGELVTINLQDSPHRAGLLKAIDNNLMEIVEAAGSSIIMHTDHIKTIHLP